MENYLTIGFNKFLTKEEPLQEWTEDEVSLRLNQVAGGLIALGESRSADDQLTVDWDNNKMTFSDSARNRVIIGYIKEEGKYGVRVIDSTGTTQLDETY